MELDWRRLFPDSDFRHPMALRPGDAGRYFQQEDLSGAMLAERRRWLTEAPELYAAINAEAEASWLPVVFAIAGWQELKSHFVPPANADEYFQSLICWGSQWEPDIVLLNADANNVYRMTGGSVCFASGWAMREKLGKTIDEIHAIVPGLNAALARQINTFLTKLAPGEVWERENWGLSADTELNHHPSRALKKLGADATLDSTWIRLERQLFFKLSQAGAILFGIRVSHHLLSELTAQPEAAARVARALETMPEEVAVYKGVGAARGALIRVLKNQ